MHVVQALSLSRQFGLLTIPLLLLSIKSLHHHSPSSIKLFLILANAMTTILLQVSSWVWRIVVDFVPLSLPSVTVLMVMGEMHVR